MTVSDERKRPLSHDPELSLIWRLVRAVKLQFGEDRRRIDHALQVMRAAEQILSEEGGDRRVVLAAAALHDIGIQEAERKHGSPAGRFQEREGPPIACRIMQDLELDASTIDHVCRIIGRHHSARGVDTREFRIVWDADWLVNLEGEYAHRDDAWRTKVVERVLKTESARSRARQLLAQGSGCNA